jgi:hypothetical protein
MPRGNPVIRLVALIAFAVSLARATPARADRIDDLSKMLESSSEKTRLSAVVSLARLADKRALKPLVVALHDPAAGVRAIAATALGHLHHKAALPALRSAATDDVDDGVRTKAREATIEVAKANQVPDELPQLAAKTDAQPEATAVAKPEATAVAKPEAPVQARHAGFGRSPHAVEDRPDLYVMIKSSSDDSPGHADKAVRKTHADIVRQTLVDSFKAAPQVTLTAEDAQRWGLDPRAIDLSVTKMDVQTEGGYVEIAAELRLAISDDTGKMLSFLSGGAKVQIPASRFKAQQLPNLRREALEGAMKGMFEKLLAHLRKSAQS